MADSAVPKREESPSQPLTATHIPRYIPPEDSHAPAISSPLNPDFKASSKVAEEVVASRERRTKKETLKKRESKGAVLSAADNGRATSEPRAQTTSGAGAGVGRGGKKIKEVLEPMRYKLPPPKLTDFDVPRGPILTAYEEKVLSDGRTVLYNETSDHVYNKKNFHYTHCIADPSFRCSHYYRSSETEPYGPRLNFEDTAAHMFLDATAHHVSTDKGFRMAKANVCARSGRWYYECKVTSGVPKFQDSNAAPAVEAPRGHVRIGWARREATLDAPVGFDAYSYGLRDVAGQKVHMSRPADFFPKGEDIREGDVIGLEINLPSESLHRKVVEGHYNPAVDLTDDEPTGIEAADIIRDRVPIRFKTHLYFEQIEYHTTKELEELFNPSSVVSSSGTLGSEKKPSSTHPSVAMRTLPHSSIKIYKNGKPMGTAFENLLAFLPPASRPLVQVGAREGIDDGMLGYYPAVSVFRGGAAELNFGPNFWFPPQDEAGNESAGPDVVMQDSDQMQSRDAGPRHHLRRPISARYDEQIAEDIVYDIIDETYFWVQDGCTTTAEHDVASLGGYVGMSRSNSQANGSPRGPEEIKELVQNVES